MDGIERFNALNTKQQEYIKKVVLEDDEHDYYMMELDELLDELEDELQRI